VGGLNPEAIEGWLPAAPFPKRKGPQGAGNLGSFGGIDLLG
jgi:hypothetical protein